MSPRLQFDAYSALANLQGRYADFLLDEMGVADAPLRERLRELWRTPEAEGGFPLFAPMHVEGAFPFRPGVTIDQAGFHPRTVKLLQDAGVTYPLHAHQVQAIEEARDGQTVIVSAGTGSGKTEAFLFPIIDRLLADHAEGRDDLRVPGVRALVIYPLNALVNNQIARIRTLLQSQDLLTYAFYTSRLPNHFKDARNRAELYGRSLEPRCQIFDRRTLRGVDTPPDGRPVGPPHILVTNFAMLEYMLVRPDDRTIFLPRHVRTTQGTPRLRAIVLDEAHVYAGAQAAEIHLLLRRAAMRFGTSLTDVQGFATSATLSSDGGHDPLTQFASQMFQKPREKVSSIVGARHLPELDEPPSQSSLTSPDHIVEDYLVAPSVRTLDHDEHGDVVGLTTDSDACSILTSWLTAYGIQDHASAARHRSESGDVPARYLFGALSGNACLVALRAWLFGLGRTATLGEVAAQLFEGASGHRAEQAASVVLCLASLARRTASAHPFIPARMHAFVRAPLGGWVDDFEKAVADAVSGTAPSNSGAPFASILTCRTCGFPWYSAWKSTDDWGDETWSGEPRPDATRVAFRKQSGGAGTPPARWGTAPVEVRELKKDRPWRAQVDGPCPRCDEENATVHALGFPARLTIAPMLDVLYPFLAERAGEGTRPGVGRRLLTFSDSRREAAKLAAQLEETHDRGLNRQILWREIRSNEEPIAVRDLIRDLATSAVLQQRALFAELQDDDDREEFLEDLALLGLYEEFARPPRRGATLETLGLIEVIYPGDIPPPDGVPLDAWRVILATLLDECRRKGAVQKPRFRSRSADLFKQLAPEFIGRSIVETDAAKTHERDPVWRTTRDTPTTRFMAHAGKALGVDPVRLSREAWDALMTRRPSWLRINDGRWSIDLERLHLHAAKHPPFFDATQRPLFRHLDGHACGPFHDIAAATPTDIERWRHGHQVRRVIDDPPLGMWTIEHTAQISPEQLDIQERLFVDGFRNVLCSSTTMEMGVDVGGLTFVLLTNVPPGPSNYLQRAGRAGRRADGSSLVLTVALDRPHDQKAFADIGSYLALPIVPPRVRLDAAPLVDRHVHSLLLTLFFDTATRATSHGNPMASFGTVGSFFVDPVPQSQVTWNLDGFGRDTVRLVELFALWLDGGGAQHHLDALGEVVAGTILEEREPVDILSETRELIQALDKSLQHDLATIAALIEEDRRTTRDDKLLASLERQRMRIEREYLIRFLTRSDFLPRFGFPIDVVSLDSTHLDTRKTGPDSDEHSPLRLDRDLVLALGEYVPGNDVIAAKQIHRSAGLIRNWELDSMRQQYLLVCNGCGGVNRTDALPTRCRTCEHPAGLGSQPDVDGVKPSRVQLFFEPAGFAVEYSSRPRRYTSAAKIEKLPHPASELRAATPQTTVELNGLELTWCPQSTLFSLSRGDRGERGFAVCQACGFAAPEFHDERLPRAFREHRILRGFKRCPNDSRFSRNVALGTTVSVDALLVDPVVHGVDTPTPVLLTLGACLRLAAATRLGVDSRTLSSVVCARPGPHGGRVAAIVEESGAGFLGALLEAPDLFMNELSNVVHGPEADLLRFETQHLFNAGLLSLDELRTLIPIPK